MRTIMLSILAGLGLTYTSAVFSQPIEVWDYPREGRYVRIKTFADIDCPCRDRVRMSKKEKDVYDDDGETKLYPGTWIDHWHH